MIIWTLPEFNPKKCGGWKPLIEQLRVLVKRKRLPVDGFEFDFSSELGKLLEFFEEATVMRYGFLLWCVLPNDMNVLKILNEHNVLINIYKMFDVLVLNSFGFFKYENRSGRLMAVSDCKLADLEALVEWMQDNFVLPSWSTLVVGIDTCTTQFHVEEDTFFAYNVNFVPTQDKELLNDPHFVECQDTEKNRKMLYCL